jgi:hypothetical protein
MIRKNSAGTTQADLQILQGFLIIMAVITLTGCSGAFWGGAGAGALGAGAGYEIQADRQMNVLNEDLKAGRISQHEYDIRKDQIQRGSLLK